MGRCSADGHQGLLTYKTPKAGIQEPRSQEKRYEGENDHRAGGDGGIDTEERWKSESIMRKVVDWNEADSWSQLTRGDKSEII